MKPIPHTWAGRARAVLIDKDNGEPIAPLVHVGTVVALIRTVVEDYPMALRQCVRIEFGNTILGPEAIHWAYGHYGLEQNHYIAAGGINQRSI